MVYSAFHELESEVRYYNRSFPVCFVRGEGCFVWDQEGREYIDFFCGAGSLNYGHNPPEIVEAVTRYIQSGGLVTSLDFMTNAKFEFLDCFRDAILRPRGLEYKVQFVGPTGSSAVEAAIKLARLSTGRQTVIAFTSAYHGVSMGALAATGNRNNRNGSGYPLEGVFRIPYENYVEGCDSAELLEKMLADPASGLDPPAAIIVETIQGEGGVNVASAGWLERIFRLSRQYGVLVIVDDIQVGCGRAGTFFSFEGIEIEPDIICLSKSIGAMGMPMSIVLLRPDIDVWQPGQHSGTFRGNNLAFVAATVALDRYWRDGSLERHMAATSTHLDGLLGSLGDRCGMDLTYRGRGLIRGIQWTDATVAKAVSRACFGLGLIVETCGPLGNVLKLLPPLNTSPPDLERGVELLAEAARLVARSSDFGRA